MGGSLGKLGEVVASEERALRATLTPQGLCPPGRGVAFCKQWDLSAGQGLRVVRGCWEVTAGRGEEGLRQSLGVGASVARVACNSHVPLKPEQDPGSFSSRRSWHSCAV